MHSRNLRRGFTLLEIMIVVAIIALAAVIAVPSLSRARQRSQNAVLINELRTTADAFQMYVADNRTFPPSASGFSSPPAGMANYLPKKGTWTTTTVGGGRWYWWRFAPGKIWGFSGLVGLYNPRFTPQETQLIDTKIDDGNLTTGNIRVSGAWVFVGVN